MSTSNKSKQPKFSLEFMQDAARLMIEKGYTQQEAADHLGVSLWWRLARTKKYYHSTNGVAV